MMHNLINIYYMLFKSCEHVHLLTTDGLTDGRTDGRTDSHTAIIVNTCGSCTTVYTLNTCYKDTVERFVGYILDQYVVRAVPELMVGEAGAPVVIFCKASSPFCI